MPTLIRRGILTQSPTPPGLSHQQLMDRLPEAILTMIHTHSVRDTEVGMEIRKALLRYQVAEDILPDDPRTVSTMTGLTNLAVALGYVDAGDVPGILASVLRPVDV